MVYVKKRGENIKEEKKEIMAESQIPWMSKIGSENRKANEFEKMVKRGDLKWVGRRRDDKTSSRQA